MPTKKSRSTSAMSDDHKVALAIGREQGRAVRSYLAALESSAPKRGRKRTPESIAKRLSAIESELPGADPLRRIAMVQERLDLTAERDAMQQTADISALEAGFVAVAKSYSERKGISTVAWRQVGVPASVLKAAGF
jgi:hypothetical protein